jgi:hypothetical protein
LEKCGGGELWDFAAVLVCIGSDTPFEAEPGGVSER